MERSVKLQQKLGVLSQHRADFLSYLHLAGKKDVYKSVSVVLHYCFLENISDLSEMVGELRLSSIYFCLILFSLLSYLRE